MKRFFAGQPLALLCITLTALAVPIRGAEKADPTGTWTWTFTGQDGQTRTSKLKLKTEADKVSGTITGRDGTETAIQDPKLTGDELSFKVVRERDGNKFTIKYDGKISGDTIKGKSEFERDGQSSSRDWEAKREGGKSAGSLTGNWKYSFTTAGGQTFEPTLKLKQAGEKVTGVIVFGENESEISDGKVSNGEFSFRVVRERDGQTFTTKYAGKLEGDQLKGKINSNWGGTDRTYDLDAKRQKD
jgi:hypothetical protein